MPGGPASKFEIIQKKAINDESVVGQNLDEITSMIISAPRPLKISFQKPYTTNMLTKNDTTPVGMKTLIHMANLSFSLRG